MTMHVPIPNLLDRHNEKCGRCPNCGRCGDCGFPRPARRSVVLSGVTIAGVIAVGWALYNYDARIRATLLWFGDRIVHEQALQRSTDETNRGVEGLRKMMDAQRITIERLEKQVSNLKRELRQ